MKAGMSDMKATKIQSGICIFAYIMLIRLNGPAKHSERL